MAIENQLKSSQAMIILKMSSGGIISPMKFNKVASSSREIEAPAISKRRRA